MGATIILNGELVPRRQSAPTALEDRGPLAQVEVYYMHCKIGRYQVKTTLEEGRESTKSNYMEYPIVKGNSPPIQRTDEDRI